MAETKQITRSTETMREALLNRKTVTMIDDDDVDHFIVKALVKRLDNVELISFKSPLSVVALIQEGKFHSDFILLDINMPGMNGWEFMEVFEANEVQVPVFIVSSSRNENDLQKSSGFKSVKGYFFKPLLLENLQKLLA
jgi:CheY-like chemotaxis protein